MQIHKGERNQTSSSSYQYINIVNYPSNRGWGISSICGPFFCGFGGKPSVSIQISFPVKTTGTVEKSLIENP